MLQYGLKIIPTFTMGGSMTDQDITSSQYCLIVPGENNQPKVVLTGGGARAEIYLHGAHLTSWIPAGGVERLFLSRSSDFGPDASIRGGVPIIFPQFAQRGPLLSHGFARRSDWEIMRAEERESSALAVFQLHDSAATRALWPHAFLAEMAVTVGGQSLELSLTIRNTGSEAFSFTSALHTYLRIQDIHSAAIVGLQGLRYFDTFTDQAEHTEQNSALSFEGETDRIYYQVPGALGLQEPARQLRVEQRGVPDVVTWNPWSLRGAALADLEPDGYLHMLCIEAALIHEPLNLEPGESWNGVQSLTA